MPLQNWEGSNQTPQTSVAIKVSGAEPARLFMQEGSQQIAFLDAQEPVHDNIKHARGEGSEEDDHNSCTIALGNWHWASAINDRSKFFAAITFCLSVRDHPEPQLPTVNFRQCCTRY
jgi:hypothetical protein